MGLPGAPRGSPGLPGDSSRHRMPRISPIHFDLCFLRVSGHPEGKSETAAPAVAVAAAAAAAAVAVAAAAAPAAESSGGYYLHAVLDFMTNSPWSNRQATALIHESTNHSTI